MALTNRAENEKASELAKLNQQVVVWKSNAQQEHDRVINLIADLSLNNGEFSDDTILETKAEAAILEQSLKTNEKLAKHLQNMKLH